MYINSSGFALNAGASLLIYLAVDMRLIAWYNARVAAGTNYERIEESRRRAGSLSFDVLQQPRASPWFFIQGFMS